MEDWKVGNPMENVQSMEIYGTNWTFSHSNPISSIYGDLIVGKWENHISNSMDLSGGFSCTAGPLKLRFLTYERRWFPVGYLTRQYLLMPTFQTLLALKHGNPRRRAKAFCNTEMPNGGKTIINHPFGNGLYNLFVVKLRMVSYCSNPKTTCTSNPCSKQSQELRQNRNAK